MQFSHDLINELRFAASGQPQHDTAHINFLLFKAADEIENLYARIAAHGREISTLIERHEDAEKRHNAIVDTLSRALNYVTK